MLALRSIVCFQGTMKLPDSDFSPVSRLLVTHADGCLVVMADAHLVWRTAHFQTGIFGGIQTYREKQAANLIFKWQKAGLVETCSGGESTHAHRSDRIESNIKTLFCFFSFSSSRILALH